MFVESILKLKTQLPLNPSNKQYINRYKACVYIWGLWTLSIMYKLSLLILVYTCKPRVHRARYRQFYLYRVVWETLIKTSVSIALVSRVIKVDDFTRRLWNIYETVRNEGISQVLCQAGFCFHPAVTWRNNNVITTPKRRLVDVIMTLLLRHVLWHVFIDVNTSRWHHDIDVICWHAFLCNSLTRGYQCTKWDAMILV